MLTNPLQIVYAFLSARGLNIPSEKRYVHDSEDTRFWSAGGPRTIVECETNSAADCETKTNGSGVPTVAAIHANRPALRPPWRAT